MKESDLQNQIMDVLLKHPAVAWATVMTSGKVKGRGGHWITLGFQGMSDIIGQLKNGQLLAIEVKLPGKRPTKLQIEFLDLVVKNGGAGCWADDVGDVLAMLEDVSC